MTAEPRASVMTAQAGCAGRRQPHLHPLFRYWSSREFAQHAKALVTTLPPPQVQACLLLQKTLPTAGAYACARTQSGSSCWARPWGRSPR